MSGDQRFGMQTTRELPICSPSSARQPTASPPWALRGSHGKAGVAAVTAATNETGSKTGQPGPPRRVSLGSVISEEGQDLLRDLLAMVLLQEMRGAGDGDLGARAGDPVAEHLP